MDLSAELEALAMAKKAKKAAMLIAAGIDHWEVDGLKLKLFPLGSATPLVMTFPDPGDFQDITINSDNELVFILKDGTELTAGTVPGRRRYAHTQDIPREDWEILHGLNIQYPSVFCFDDEGDRIVGQIEYYSQNLVKVHFGKPLTGTAIIKE